MALDTMQFIAEKYHFDKDLKKAILTNIKPLFKTRELAKEANIVTIINDDKFDLELWNKALEIHNAALVIDAHAHACGDYKVNYAFDGRLARAPVV